MRTPVELAVCRELLAESGLLDRSGFELWVMAEVPSVLYHLERYAELGVVGISIGSNDLTQLMLGADRDSDLLAELFDERDPAVVEYLRELIPRARSTLAWQPRSAARRHRCTRNTPSCWFELGSTPSPSTSTPSIAPAGWSPQPSSCTARRRAGLSGRRAALVRSPQAHQLVLEPSPGALLDLLV